jgi:deazaflavin-dependent oxidoreductase (nitroreductase family)
MLLRAPIWVYRARLGFLLGHRFLYLAHRGRVSGRRRETVLEVVEYDRAAALAYVVSGWGPRSDWFRNLQVGQALEVRIATRHYQRPAHHILDPDETLELLTRYRRQRPRTWRQLAKIMGLSPDASGSELRRGAEQLPAVRFTLTQPGAG